jgi:hypothetical protein
MPRYAIVAVVDSPQPEEAWERIGKQLLGDDEGSIAYVGAPWLVPDDASGEPAEIETDGIQLRLNGKRISLRPID